MLISTDVTSLAAGLLFSLSLLAAIGTQNTFVLRQGVLRGHVGDVVAICSISDVLLVAAGVAGASPVLDGRTWLRVAVRAFGAAFLLGYALLAARRAIRSETAPVDQSPPRASRLTVAGTCLALTWLNPAVYFDTVVLLGSVANTRPGHQWWFGGGAMLASTLWFGALGFGARLLTPVFRRPHAWRVLDSLVAVVMVGSALRVLLL